MSDIVSIVGGGWSFAEVDHVKVPGHIIAVNGAAEHFRARYHEAVTMDRLWLQHFWTEARAAHSGQDAWALYVRNHAAKNLPPAEIDEAKSQRWLHIFKNNNSGNAPMSRVPGELNGDNSGACALNRAFQIGPKEIYLFGFDMCRSPKGLSYWYPAYPWVPKTGGSSPSTMGRWAKEFSLMAQQFKNAGIKVTNVSSASIIKAFPRVTPKVLGVHF